MEYKQYSYITKYNVENINELKAALREAAEKTAGEANFIVYPSLTYIIQESYSTGTVKLTYNVAVENVVQ